MSFASTLDKYVQSDDFKSGVIASTRASWGGSGYSVELFNDGTWRNLWNSSIGNKYKSVGVIIPLPALDTDGKQQYINEGAGDEEDFMKEQFYIEEQEIAQLLRDALK